MQVTTLLSDADKRIAEAGSSGTQWLAEATAAAETVKTAAAQEAEQGEKIRALKEQVWLHALLQVSNCVGSKDLGPCRGVVVSLFSCRTVKSSK